MTFSPFGPLNLRFGRYSTSAGTTPSGRRLHPQVAGDYPGIAALGPKGLLGVLEDFFLPEIERALASRGPIEEAFLGQALTPGALYGAASEAARGEARKLFAPGGEVAGLVGRARGGTIQRGFAPEAARGSEDAVLRAATQRVSDVFATQAGALEGQRFGALTGAYGQAGESIRDLIESLYTGIAGQQQLRLARDASRPRFLGLF